MMWMDLGFIRLSRWRAAHFLAICGQIEEKGRRSSLAFSRNLKVKKILIGILKIGYLLSIA
jgi:hypothetical protein